MSTSRRRWLLLLAAAPMTAQASPPRVILLLGPPGAGKTTQAEKLSRLLRIPAISMADVLRREGGGRTQLNKALRAQIAGGELISDEAANQLIGKRIARKDAQGGFILDGYPGTARQAEYFDALLVDRALPKPVVIHLSIPDTVADTRLQKRGRADDEPANIERRIVEYRDQAALILGRYTDSVKTIDGSKSPDTVAQSIREALGL
jgi:adenylate kinase